MPDRFSGGDWFAPGLLLVARLMLLPALTLEGLRGYGDLGHYFRLAGMGLPFFDLWVEYPPVFPFLASLLYRLSGGREHVFDYLLAILLALAQAGGLWLFLRIARRLHGEPGAGRRGWAYFALLAGLVYGWWYFDPLVVFFMLLGLYWLLDGRLGRAGVALAAGMLLKWFPGLVLAAAWQRLPARRAAFLSVLTAGGVAASLAWLYAASPEMTAASLRSQGSKGSWETVWALIDGNLHTGNFGPLAERSDPEAALHVVGNPPRLPMWATFPFFAVLGAASWWQVRRGGPDAASGLSTVSFLGLAWCLFLLWLPGYSPQWALYLLPLVLLVLPEREACLAAVLFALVNLLEWPVLLSRGLFQALWLTIPVRSGLLVLYGIRFWEIARKGAQAER
jgi:hypothetical protein